MERDGKLDVAVLERAVDKHVGPAHGGIVTLANFAEGGFKRPMVPRPSPRSQRYIR
jgi:hypothetical protein